MSKSKKQVITQEALNTTPEFDKFFAKEGLKVIDAYSAWCGPCKALAGFIKTLKTEISDPILHFAMANTDNIELLAAYRGTSEPITLIFGGQTLVNVIRGANSPFIEAEVKAALVVEHDAIENGTARVEFVDVALEAAEAAAPAEDAAPEEPKLVKTYSLAVIKSDVCAAEGKADAIIADLAEAGFKVSTIDDVEYTEETAKAAFAGADDDFIASVTSGPCKKLVLCNSKVDAVSSLLSILSPAAEPEAKSEGGEEAKPDEQEEAKPEGEEGAEAGPAEEEEEEAKVAPSLLEKHELEPGSIYGSATAEAATAEITAAFPEWAAENLGKEESVEAAAPAAEGDGAAADDAAAPPAEGDAAAAAEAEPAAAAAEAEPAAAAAEAEAAPAAEAEAPAEQGGDAAAAPPAEGDAAAQAEAEPATPAAEAEPAAPAAEAEAAPAAEAEAPAEQGGDAAEAEAAPQEEAKA